MKTFNFASMNKVQKQIEKKISEETVNLTCSFSLRNKNGAVIQSGSITEEVKRKDLRFPVHGERVIKIKTPDETVHYGDQVEEAWSYFHMILNVGYNFEGTLHLKW